MEKHKKLSREEMRTIKGGVKCECSNSPGCMVSGQICNDNPDYLCISTPCNLGCSYLQCTLVF